MNLKYRILFFIITGLFTVIASILFQINNGQVIDDQTLKEEIQDLDSSISESQQLISYYTDNKITFTYLQNQLQQINQKNQSFSQSLITSKTKKENYLDIKETVDIQSGFSLLLSNINGTNGDKKQIAKISQEVDPLSKSIKKLHQKYE